MLRTALSIMALTTLTGCGCIPEGSEGVMVKSYFDDCWNEASKGPRRQVLFPKP